jgi:hypothetical protein
MKPYRATASALIKAPADQVYAILADYRDGHPRILPRQYFPSLEVEQGGVGAGTIIRFQTRAMGQTQTFRAVITEPEPGRRLVETCREPDEVVTSFTVDPTEQGRQAQVTITTEGRTRTGGVLGWLEQRMVRLFLQGIYKKEFRLLEALAQQRASGTGEAP